MAVKIAERRFTIEAPRSRIWNLLGRALMNSPIGLEKIEVIDEHNVRAEVRVKFAFVPLTTRLTITFLEMVEPEKMVVLMNAKALGSLINLRQRITFTLDSPVDSRTEVTCEATAEGSNSLLFRVLAKKVKGVAENTLSGIEKSLKRWA